MARLEQPLMIGTGVKETFFPQLVSEQGDRLRDLLGVRTASSVSAKSACVLALKRPWVHK